MRLTIRHETRYQFDTPVKYGLQQLRKTPPNSAQQEV
ncbi:MAG TPA: transglutaminase, partial [Roseovarius nubinhibens]|nr:transglutaminase [Roseovarius nubinhibens]